ncbi:hypothetical protein PC9H_004881 [Pleurotus ostreatus]|uniref:Uncharacterized protein n=1 Tax=Pleurotus ostreatus TaxID=5322 RepID=A0A8H7DTT5_PLEOS|nr:uncharacterized protein PC9H_004881 [Pleurotus ostreatus]KAF7432937.1 hypothetical protein PC9H_004881 [Pleurotus ostreatus]KAJ8698477.1 hypothetical protein PTI98_005183 [Pleurotus ostreatus]
MTSSVPVDDDSIDAETLQAQIDMSLSFAQDLVTSWIKPSNKMAPRSTRNIEDELKEYMRRPPRLGVGAPIPESAGTSRDAARLKQQLTSKGGKKRAADDMMDRNKKGDSDDDGEESRAHAIRKKVKISDHDSIKKVHMAAPESAPRPPPQIPTKPPGSPRPTAGAANLGIPDTPSRPKKKKKKHGGDARMRSPSPASQHPPSCLEGKSDRLPENARDIVKHAMRSPINGKADLSPAKASSSADTSPEKLQGATNSRGTAPITSVLASVLAGKSKDLSSMLRGPLLNLDGPPVGSDDEGDGPGPESPSKKRRRRRKKTHTNPAMP